MEWISVGEKLPDFPKDRKNKVYLVCVKKENSRTRIKLGKWEIRRHRKPQRNESVNDVLKESNRAIWIVSGYKGKEVTHWLPIPTPPPPVYIDEETKKENWERMHKTLNSIG